MIALEARIDWFNFSQIEKKRMRACGLRGGRDRKLVDSGGRDTEKGK